MRLHTLSLADARALDTLEHQFEYGGQAGYSYSRYFAASVTGSNSQFNPISARLYGMVPYWFWPGLWNAEMHPWAEVNMLWLHSMRPTDQAGRVGALELGDNNFYLHGYAGLPLLGLGPVVIFGLAGGEFNASREGVHSGTGIFGGGLSAHFLDRLDIEAAGAATLHGDPLVMLRVSYSR
jgi:hypothetical protein